jgi:UDP-glucose:(heptosyl)LPS alpha-1,3-glucosyltransferase
LIKLAIVRQKYNPHGGAERFVARALQTLSTSQALDVTLLAREWQDGGPWQCQCLRPFYLGRTWRDRAFARVAQARFAEFDLVQSHERIPGASIFRAGDGVHAVWLEEYARTQSPLANALRRLSPYHRYICAAEAAMFRHPALKMVICNSKLVRDQIARRFGVPDDRLCVIYNGVDPTVFSPALADRHRTAQRAAWGISMDALLLAYVGSGFERKGVSTAIRAIAMTTDTYLVIAGQDRAARRYRQLAEQLSIANRVRFLGGLNDVKPVYGAADALILPTLYDPFPNVCLEALACGLPVFTSPWCGAAEWISEGVNGWVRDALDVEGYAAAINDSLAQRARWPALRAAARATAEPHTLEKMGRELEALYHRLLTSEKV